MNFLRIKEGWSIFILAWAMVLVGGYTIWQADLTNGLQVLMLIGTVGYVAGYFLAHSAFSGRVAAAFSLVYGLFFITYLIGGRFLALELTWPERVADLIARQQDWIGKAIYGGTSRDRLIFVMHTSAIFWVLGYTAAWYTFRTPRLWRVVLPSGIVQLSVVYYYYGPKPLWLYLALYVLIALLYIARTYLADQEGKWREAVVRYERSITFSFLRAGFVVALVALMGAWMMPTLTANAAMNDALGGINRPIRRFQDNWTRLFSSLRSYGTGTNDAYGGSLPLGGPRNVSDTLIMDVFVKGRLPYAYWRAGIYETYANGEWLAPDGERTMRIPDEGLVTTSLYTQREILTQTVRTYQPNTGTLYGLPDPVGSDKQMFVTQQYDADGASHISLLQSRYVLQQGDRYQTVSRLSVADESSLRSAGTDYPEWIDPYLQVSDGVTLETIDLARQLTAGYSNPYDKAIAVRDFLRTTIIYNDQIEAPPQDVDPVHYILFESRQGYCNYYASAMALMLRSQGIPARLSVGYAAGEFIEEANVYRVRASDAHTWVEVFFPNYGWIQFEPTASIATVDRPTGQGGDGRSPLAQFQSRLEGGDQIPEDDFLDPRDRLLEDETPGFQGGAVSGRLARWLNISNPVAFWRTLGAIAIVILSGVALYLANILNTRVETDVAQSYKRLGSWGKWLGIHVQPAHTPYERAEMLAAAMPEGRRPIRNLTQHFVLQLFSPHVDQVDEFEPQAEWKALRPILIRHTLANLWQRLRSYRIPRRYRIFR